MFNAATNTTATHKGYYTERERTKERRLIRMKQWISCFSGRRMTNACLSIYSELECIFWVYIVWCMRALYLLSLFSVIWLFDGKYHESYAMPIKWTNLPFIIQHTAESIACISLSDWQRNWIFHLATEIEMWIVFSVSAPNNCRLNGFRWPAHIAFIQY